MQSHNQTARQTCLISTQVDHFNMRCMKKKSSNSQALPETLNKKLPESVADVEVGESLNLY